MDEIVMSILDQVNFPKDIKNLSKAELDSLSSEIRRFLIDNVSKTGGHLASNLGVVELTIAMHRVFDMPRDKAVFDVGHQTYVHKILTGRKDKFNQLRMFGGMSGYAKPCESEYDPFGAGHSSTSISSALGIARARDIKGEDYNVIAVIGDGALTGGLALEALNDAGSSDTNLIVILNDNEMSIAKNVGGLSSYLSKLRTNPAYMTIKKDVQTFFKKLPGGDTIVKSIDKVKDGIKYFILQGILFEELGFKYLGPIDGHDIEKMSEVLERAKKVKKPVLVHVVTKKGKGYSYAEDNPDVFHGVGPFLIETGRSAKSSKTSYSNVFGEEIVKEAEKNERIVAVTAAMPDGTGLKEFSNRFKDRFFDVAIAEAHAVTMSAGLASNGLKPVFAVYSSFLQRAYDSIIHDVCIQNLPVMFAIDRAGIVGEDGETHQGLMDLTYLRSIPNMTVVAPKDINEFRIMLKWCFDYNGPVAIRYPRGGDYDVEFKTCSPILYKKWETILEGNDCAILACGKMVQLSLMAAERLNKNKVKPLLVNCRFIKPLDNIYLNEIFKKYDKIFIVEDNYTAGGFGSSVIEAAASASYKGKIHSLGFPEEFVTHGDCDILYKKYGLDAEGIYRRVLKNI